MAEELVSLLDRASTDLLSAGHTQPLAFAIAVYRDGHMVTFSPVDNDGNPTVSEQTSNSPGVELQGFATMTLASSELPTPRTCHWIFQKGRWRLVCG
jgi:hypothetical protein